MGNAANKTKYISASLSSNSLSSETQQNGDKREELGMNSTANQDVVQSPEEKERQLAYLEELVTAIKDNATLKVIEILSRGVNLTKTYDERCFEPLPLVTAAQNGSLEICKLLLEHRADVNQRTYAGITPLIKASENGYLDVVRLLLDHNADIEYCVEQEGLPLGIRWELDDARDSSKVDDILEPFQGNNSLMKSCREHHVDVVKELLQRGCDINCKNTMGNTALHISCLSRTCNAYASSTSCHVPARLFLGGNAEIVRLLVENGALVNALNCNKETPFMRALNGPQEMMDWDLGETEMVEILDSYHKIIGILLQAGTRVDLPDREGHSALYKLLEITKVLDSLEEGLEYTPSLCDLITDVVSLGCNFTSKDQTWFIKYKDFFDKQTSVCSGMLEWLQTAVNSPLSLKQMSRMVIRKHLHEPILLNIKKLRIPNLTKDYIILKSH